MSISATINGQNALTTTDPLPIAVEEITTVWCSKILGAEVTEAVIFAVRHGSSSTVAVDLTYGSEQIALPRRIYVKGGFNPQLIAVAPSLLGTYRREAEFYHDLAPSLNIRLPKTFYCGTNQTSGQGIVVMEDLRAKECTFGNPLEPWPVAKVRLGIEQLAILHAKTWGSDKIQMYSWLKEANPLRGIVLELMVPGPFDVVATNLKPLGEKARVLTDRQRMINAFQTLWKTEDPKYHCIVHGDAHIENTFILPSGEPGFIDWQALFSGSCFHDVAYFVIGSLTVEDRRQHEASILDSYLDLLHANGGPRLRREEIWDEYRKHIFHGFGYCLAQPSMQPQENIWAMAERYGTAIVDHQVVELLEALAT